MRKNKIRWSVKITLIMAVISVFVTVMGSAIYVHAAGAQEEKHEETGEGAGDDNKSPDLLLTEDTEPVDKTRPTLNASVSDGILSIRAYDKDSGIKVIYVNGYEYMDPEDGKVVIRLTQFDAGYEYFEISAMDGAGNMSAVYRTRNPYYRDPESDDEEDPAADLPLSAEPTDPADAEAIVINHYNDNPDAIYGGREFYTIESESGKQFYLIIDRTGDEEIVYFLTEITENDLLNVTSDNSETLPRNSAAAGSQIPVTEVGIPGSDLRDRDNVNEKDDDDHDEDGSAAEKISEAVENAKKNPMTLYIIMGVFGAAVIGAGYYFKVVKPKKDGNFVEDEDDEDEEYDDSPTESEEDYTPPIEDAADTIGDDAGSDPK